MIIDGDDLRNITINKDYSRKEEKEILELLKILHNLFLTRTT